MIETSVPLGVADIDIILDVDPVAPPLTGIGIYALELARRLPSASGIGVVRYTANGTWITDLEGRRSVDQRGRMPRNSVLQQILRPVHRVYRAQREIRAARRFEACGNAVYHGTNYAVPDFPGASVVTIHDLSVLRYPQFHPTVRVDTMKQAIERTIERADALIAVSEFARSEVIELLNWSPESVFAIHNGVSPEFRCRTPDETRPVLHRYGLTHDRYALCVASIEPRKNIDGLLSAYSGLPIAVRDRYPLVLAGEPGWNSAEIHQRIRRYAAEGWLQYLGYVPEQHLPELFAGARGFIYPSLYEGFGLPIVEAMASGVPVVTSDGSSLVEVAGGAALLVEPHDVDALTAAVERLLEDDGWRHLARQNSLNVARKFTWDSTVSKTAEVYRYVHS